MGIDTISVDVGNSTHYKAHHAMYSRNVYGMENMNNLDKVRRQRHTQLKLIFMQLQTLPREIFNPLVDQ